MSVLINAYSTLRELPAIRFPHDLHGQRSLPDPELSAHLDGFIGYVLPDTPEGMTAARYHIWCHLKRVRHQVSLTVADEQLDDFASWASDANAVLFLPDGTVRDPSGEVLFDPEDDSDSPGEIPYPPSALQRRTKSQHLLHARELPFLEDLPPVAGDEEVEWQTASDVARRCLALTVTAITAESLATNSPFPGGAWKHFQEKCPIGVAALSPDEQAFVQAKSPPQQDVINFAWRYEALFALQWALGLVETLPFPAAICDVPLVARLSLDHNSQAWVDSARLRPTTELLDALDLHYRLEWATRNRSFSGVTLEGKAEPGVAHERYYALNWLARYENADWDDVDTPT